GGAACTPGRPSTANRPRATISSAAHSEQAACTSRRAPVRRRARLSCNQLARVRAQKKAIAINAMARMTSQSISSIEAHSQVSYDYRKALQCELSDKSQTRVLTVLSSERRWPRGPGARRRSRPDGSEFDPRAEQHEELAQPFGVRGPCRGSDEIRVGDRRVDRDVGVFA